LKEVVTLLKEGEEKSIFVSLPEKGKNKLSTYFLKKIMTMGWVLA